MPNIPSNKKSAYHKHTVCFTSVLMCFSFPTSGGVRWSELQRVAQYVVVVPHIKLVVPRVVVHGGNVLIGVGERDVDRFLPCMVGIIGVHHQVATCFTVIVLIDRSNRVKNAAGHEGVGCHPFVEAGLPSAFKSQRVRIHLRTKRKKQT